VSLKSLRDGANLGCFAPGKVLPGAQGFWRWNECGKDRQRRQLGVYWSVAERPKWKFQFKLLEAVRSVDHSEKTIGGHEMPLVTVVITLCVVGILLWLVNRFIPMQGTIKGILNAVVVIAVVLWLLKVFDLYQYISQFRVGH
jgi:hypothetical protein